MSSKFELKKVSGREFIDDILRGKREFIGIQMTPGYDVSSHPNYKSFVIYLKKQDFSKKPIDISLSNFTGFQAIGLNLQFLKAVDTDLSGANFQDSNLNNANFKRAFLINSNFLNANLKHATLIEANLMSADLTNANLKKSLLEGAGMRGATLKNTDLTNVNFFNVNLKGVDFEEANLKNVKNLNSAKNLGYSILYEVRNCSDKNKKLIMNAIEQRRGRLFSN